MKVRPGLTVATIEHKDRPFSPKPVPEHTLVLMDAFPVSCHSRVNDAACIALGLPLDILHDVIVPPPGDPSTWMFHFLYRLGEDVSKTSNRF